MYCSNCGTQIAENARFCSSCGVEILTQQQAPAKPRKRRNWLLTLLLWIVIGFLFSFGMMKASALWPDQMPFFGLWPGVAEARAASYVENYFPEFKVADRYVSAVYMDGQPLYVVDFISPIKPEGLRILVSRNLRQIWPYEYANGQP